MKTNMLKSKKVKISKKIHIYIECKVFQDEVSWLTPFILTTEGSRLMLLLGPGKKFALAKNRISKMFVLCTQ